MDIGKVQPAELTSELSKSYLDYAMSVIVSRALPDVRDGLKPVHRRIFYAMQSMGLRPGSTYTKSAKVVGEVLGKFHPHGDMAVYDALVRLAQDFSMRYPLVDGQGNFGSVDGDSAAAMRYTEVRLAKISGHLLNDIEKDTVDFTDNFDTTLKEPSYLPATLPNLLLMGSEGIAVGMATKIPPHHLGESIDAIVETIKKGKATANGEKPEIVTDLAIKKIDLIAAGTETKESVEEDLMKPTDVTFDSEITTEELMQSIPGPDFPTGGVIYGANGLIDVYATGRGRIVVRGVAAIEEGRRGKNQIVITELPYQVNKANLVRKVAGLVRDKKLSGISDLRDESDKDGMRVVIELKRASRPKSVLNNLYKHTRLQNSFSANFVVLVNGVPQTVNLKIIVVEYVKHRQKVVIRRTIFELTAAKRRAHILEGLKIALDNLDEVIKIIRASKTQEAAKVNLIEKFKFSDIQATAILDMQLRRLAALERDKIEKEYNEIKKLIDRLVAILKDPKRVLDIIAKELAELKEAFADKRRTKIYKQSLGEFSEEDLVPKEDTLITVTKTGYVKRVSRGTFKSQRRGGKGVIGMATKGEDEIDHLVSASTHDTLLFFTNLGKVYSTRAWEIGDASRQSKGQALVNLINVEQDEKVKSVLVVNGEAKHLIMATKKGIVKKTKLKEFQNLRSNGLIAIKLSEADELVSVDPTAGEDHILLVTKKAKSIRFPEANVRAMGRATTGVKGINLNADDEVISMEVFSEKRVEAKDGRKKTYRDILSISEHGLGKRTRVGLFPVQKRGGKGVKAATVSGKSGNLVSACLVNDKIDQVIITSKGGQIIKLPLRNIPQMGRSTQGVILMRFAKKSDSCAAVTAFESPEKEEEKTK